MEKEILDYLEDFEDRLYDLIFSKCISLQILTEDRLPQADEIIMWWKDNAPLFMRDAVREFNGYPTVVLAWAGFLGMAVASQWDKDWQANKDNDYLSYYGASGFDDMDENIMENYLNIRPDSKRWNELSDIFRSLSNDMLNFIRHEKIEGGTEKAFHALARSLRIMFILGAAIELKALGYKWEKMNIGQTITN